MEKTIAILMADLTGFTAMTEIHGSQMAALVIEKYINLVKKSLVGESYMLERAGDQVVVISPLPDDLAYTAINLLNNAKVERHFLPIHAGMHFGEALELDGHFYGSSVNLAARIASKAKDGKLLCSRDFVDALSDTEEFRFTYHGRMKFKNVFQSKEIIELQPATINLRRLDVCPVCHMQLSAGETLHQYTHDRHSYYFCSNECKEVFLKYELYNTVLTA